MTHEQFADPVESADTLADFRRVLAFEVNPITWAALGEAFADYRVTDWNLAKWFPAAWSADAVRDIRMRRAQQ